MKKCEICNKKDTEDRIIFSNQYGGYLCNRHYSQYLTYGKILKRTVRDPNEFIFYEDYAEIVCYTRNNKEKGRLLIDLEDVEKCKNHKWSISSTNYGYTTSSRRESISIHHFVMNDTPSDMYDHINRNTLDNRKSNLRETNKSLNALNTDIRINNTSGFTGVSWNKERNKWEAYLKCIGSKRKNLGRFSNKKDAIKARLEAELNYFSTEFAPQRHLFEEYGIVLD